MFYIQYQPFTAHHQIKYFLLPVLLPVKLGGVGVNGQFIVLWEEILLQWGNYRRVSWLIHQKYVMFFNSMSLQGENIKIMVERPSDKKDNSYWEKWMLFRNISRILVRFHSNLDVFWKSLSLKGKLVIIVLGVYELNLHKTFAVQGCRRFQFFTS